ncbi:MAG: mechanosensitive ion channel [Nitrospirae bacterium]|nr:MAG: mechanosensitive ion channel [Nitrospirota bacterium]
MKADMIGDIFFAILIFALFYGAGQLVKRAIKLGLSRYSKEITKFIADTVYIVIIIIGIITALSRLGINTSALIASLGLGGFALGFALKDIVANFVSGVLILLTEPFKIGDYIEASGKTGKVKELNLRHTVIEDESGNDILIPNNNIYTTVILKRKKDNDS